ncbi:MAG: hypothetical protein ACKO7G_15565, partial [Gammaproteobacteria bacterium]
MATDSPARTCKETSRTMASDPSGLTQLNGKPVETLTFKGDRGDGFANRDQNITWQADLGDDNKIVEGRWWTPA